MCIHGDRMAISMAPTGRCDLKNHAFHPVKKTNEAGVCLGGEQLKQQTSCMFRCMLVDASEPADA